MASFEAIQAEVANMLDVNDDELTPEMRDMMDAYLEELADQEEAKVDGFGQFIRVESARAEALNQEAKRLAAKARAAENRINFLKMRYLSIMQEHGLKKVQGKVYSLAIRETPVVQIDDEAALPAEYITEKVTVSPNKLMLKDALKSGIEIPGVRLATSYSLQAR